MIEIALALSLSFGQASWTLDIYPRTHFAVAEVITFPITNVRACGVALPHVAFTVLSCDAPHTLRHEDRHLDQYEALGPAITLAHLMTNGHAIEDYLGPPSSTWYPPPGMRNCPALRIQSDATASFMPCWRLR